MAGSFGYKGALGIFTTPRLLRVVYSTAYDSCDRIVYIETTISSTVGAHAIDFQRSAVRHNDKDRASKHDEF